MTIHLKTPGVHHVALRVTDFQRSKRFYIGTLGFEAAMEAENFLLFMAGGTAVAVRGPAEGTAPDDTFDPFRVGLDHVALGCDDEAELERVASALTGAGVWNTGVKMDDALGKRYVAFKDPDGIKWEYYAI